MANTPVSMTKLKHMLQLLASGNSQRGVCGILHMGRNVLSTYVKRALATDKDYKRTRGRLGNFRITFPWLVT